MDRARSEEKLALLRQLLKEEGVECLLVTQTHHFAWLTGGRSFVPLNTESGVSQLFVDHEGATVLTTSIEVSRMEEEECRGFKVLGADWRELPASMAQNLAQVAKGRDVERDTGRLAGKLDDLQVQLTDADLEEFRALGADCGLAIAEVARAINVGDTEYEVAGLLSSALMKRGVDPVVLLVAFDERISKYRHPLPGRSNFLKQTAMLVIGGRRKGLCASATRMVCFGEVPSELRTKHDAVAHIDAEVILSTAAGVTAEALYSTLAKAYTDRGFADEIALHHQGGLTGYKTRYWKAQPGLTKPVVAGCCFAWNPSITGTKSEDTIYLPKDGGKPEVLTASPDWPMLTVALPDGRGTLQRPDILVR